MPRYHLPDEPQPGRIAHLAVNPLWPLLGSMLGGPWLGWPWFVVNGLAVGSPTRGRERALVLLGLVGAGVLLFVVFGLTAAGLLEGMSLRFALLAVTLWKLAIAYLVYTMQARPFALYEHYGGRLRNGALVAFAGVFLDGPVRTVLGGGFWALVLG